MVCKRVDFHSYQMPIGLGSLTCFLTSEDDELLANQNQFKVILQDQKTILAQKVSYGNPIFHIDHHWGSR